MRKVFASLLLSVLAQVSPAGAAGDTGRLYVAELAMFACPHCREVEEAKTPLVNSLGERLRFVPLPESREDIGTLSYYALRHLEPESEGEVRSALFAGKQDLMLPLATPEEVIELFAMKNAAKGVSPEELKAALESDPVQASLSRMANLLTTSAVTSVPAFVFIRDGKVIATYEKQAESANEFVRRVLQEVRSYE